MARVMRWVKGPIPEDSNPRDSYLVKSVWKNEPYSVVSRIGISGVMWHCKIIEPPTVECQGERQKS